DARGSDPLRQCSVRWVPVKATGPCAPGTPLRPIASVRGDAPAATLPSFAGGRDIVNAFCPPRQGGAALLSLACLASLLAVCRASIRGEIPGDVASFASPWRGKRRVCERHKRLLTDQLPSLTHADTLRDVQSSQPRAASVDEPRPVMRSPSRCSSTSMRGMKMRSSWAFRDGCSREVDRHTLRVLSLQVYGQQHTLLCDNDVSDHGVPRDRLRLMTSTKPILSA